ncbi:hypothetical protein GJ744_003574 [Endocarpon pusillum]|uniref:NACHT domain-containing protein n=1 Tax=Endocarpon pusillum TaxID=364733 RepID=A0A8H7E218_9EURO|nr:hypothetical protein GJ744_003574 [Endocarpon pusillum]
MSSPSFSPPSTSLQRQAIENARAAFARLPNGDVVFRQCINQKDTVAEIMKMTTERYRSHRDKRSSRLLQGFQHYTLWLQNISGVVDVAVQTQAGIGCPLWAPVKFVLQVSKYHAQVAEKILDMIQTISDTLTRFQIYEKLHKDTILQIALLNIFTDVVVFCVVTFRYFRRGALVRLGGLIASPFKEELAEVTERLKTHAKIVDHTAVATELVRASEFRNHMLSRERLDMKLKYEQWLKPSNVREVYQHLLSSKLYGTCNWIWAHPTFVKWNNLSNSTASDQLLCIHGTNGCGKSVLASSIVEALNSQQQHVFFFSFSGTDASRQTLDALVRALLWQLLQEIGDEQSFSIMQSLISRGPPISSDLWDAFDRAASLVTEPMYWVIDGVDECKDSSQELFRQLLDLLALHSNARAILLGRPCLLQAISPTIYAIEISFSLNKADIDSFISSELSKSEVLSVPELRHSVSKTIQEKSDGMFLWVKLMMEDLSKSASRYEVIHRLRNLPRGLEETYRFLLGQLVDRLDDFELRLARSVLAFTVVACRPLKLEELQYAHALEIKLASDPLEERPFQDYLLVRPMQKILHVCGGLVAIRGGIVRLIHLSVKEFLTRPEGAWPCENDHKAKGLRVNLEDSHRALATVGLGYLGMNESISRLQLTDSLSELWTWYPFLEYAWRYTFHHLSRSGAPSSIILSKLSLFLRSEKSVSWVELWPILLLDDGSTGSEFQDLMDFMLWLQKSGHEQNFSEILGNVFNEELASRVSAFGEDDVRTKRWRMIMELSEDEDWQIQTKDGDVIVNVQTEDRNLNAESEDVTSNAQDEFADITSGVRTATTSTEASQFMALLNHATTLPLQRQLDWLLRLQCQLHRAKVLTDPLKLLLRIILQKASSVSVNVLWAIGRFYERLGKYNEALEVYHAALAKLENREVPIKFQIIYCVGIIHWKLQSYDMALEFFQKTLIGEERLLGTDHINTLYSIEWIGNTYNSQQQFSEALEWYQKTLIGKERLLGTDHKDTFVTIYMIGVVYHGLEQYDNALKWFQKALIGEERLLGTDHINTLYSMEWIGRTYYSQQQFSEALEWYQKTLIGKERLLGADHINTLSSMEWIGRTYYSQQQFSEALEWYQKTLIGKERLLGADHINTLYLMEWIGDTYYGQQQYPEALGWYQKTLMRREAMLEANDGDIFWTMERIAKVYDKQGQYDKALEWYQKALTGMVATLGADHEKTLDVKHNTESLIQQISEGR